MKLNLLWAGFLPAIALLFSSLAVNADIPEQINNNQEILSSDTTELNLDGQASDSFYGYGYGYGYGYYPFTGYSYYGYPSAINLYSHLYNHSYYFNPYYNNPYYNNLYYGYGYGYGYTSPLVLRTTVKIKKNHHK